MAYEFRLEDPGEGIHEAEIRELLVSEGDKVKEGDDVLVAETDKAAVEIPAPVTGTVERIAVSEGDIVEVGDVLMTFDVEDEEAEAEEEEAEEEGAEEKEAEEKETEEEREDAEAERNREKPERRRARERRASEEGEAEEPAKPEGRAKRREGKSERRAEPGGRPVPATPKVRGLARELGVELSDIDGSGRNGRVLEDDVRRAAEGVGRRRARDEARQPDDDKWGETERLPLRSVRRAIAQRMERAWAEIPHVTHQDEIDITDLEKVRRAHADEAEKRGGHLTLTPLFVKALVAALKEHPRFNASLDREREEIVLKRFYNIGVALDTERGLMVPVLHGADAKSVMELAVELNELAETLRDGDAKGDQLRGGTFSLTNIGSLGGTQFTPLINHPEAAIFGTGRAQLRAVAVGDLDDHRFEARLILPVCVTFDHRINDGADAARFMDTVKTALSDPEALMLMG